MWCVLLDGWWIGVRCIVYGLLYKVCGKWCVLSCVWYAVSGVQYVVTVRGEVMANGKRC